MTTLEQLEILVKMSHPNELESLQRVRRNAFSYTDLFVNLVPFFGMVGFPSGCLISELPDGMMDESIPPEVAIASRSSLPTIQEAYQDYLASNHAAVS